MNGDRWIFGLSLLLLASCNQTIDSSDLAGKQKPATDKEVLRSIETVDELLDLQNEINEFRKAENRPLEFLIDLPSAEGWEMSEPQLLYDGLVVEYEHKSLSMGIRLSQYSKSHSFKTDDVNSDGMKEELKKSNAAMQKVVEDGSADSMTLVDEGVVVLGESSTKTLWAKHIVKIGMWRKVAENFIWSYKNHIFIASVEVSPRRSQARKAR